MKSFFGSISKKLTALAALGALLALPVWWSLASRDAHAQQIITSDSKGQAAAGNSKASSDGATIIHVDRNKATTDRQVERRGDPEAAAQYQRWRDDRGSHPDRSSWDYRTHPRHDDLYRDRRPPRNYYYFGSHYYPLLDCEDFYYPGAVVILDGDSGYPAQPSTATYEIVKPEGRQWVEGHWEEVAMQDVIEGEYVEVYHPAVYRKGEDGNLEAVEKEQLTKEPKVRIILTKVWVEGHWADEDGAAPAAESDKGTKATQ